MESMWKQEQDEQQQQQEHEKTKKKKKTTTKKKTKKKMKKKKKKKKKKRTTTTTTTTIIIIILIVTTTTAPAPTPTPTKNQNRASNNLWITMIQQDSPWYDVSLEVIKSREALQRVRWGNSATAQNREDPPVVWTGDTKKPIGFTECKFGISLPEFLVKECYCKPKRCNYMQTLDMFSGF